MLASGGRDDPSGRLVRKTFVGAGSGREVVPPSSNTRPRRTDFLGKEEVSSSNLDAGSITLLEFKWRNPGNPAQRCELANLVKGYVAAARARGLSRSTLENSYGRHLHPLVRRERGTAAIRRVAAIPRPVLDPAPRYGRETGALTTWARNPVDQFLWAHSLNG